MGSGDAGVDAKVHSVEGCPLSIDDIEAGEPCTTVMIDGRKYSPVCIYEQSMSSVQVIVVGCDSPPTWGDRQAVDSGSCEFVDCRDDQSMGLVSVCIVDNGSECCTCNPDAGFRVTACGPC
jgi:hypothetical protein